MHCTISVVDRRGIKGEIGEGQSSMCAGEAGPLLLLATFVVNLEPNSFEHSTGCLNGNFSVRLESHNIILPMYVNLVVPNPDGANPLDIPGALMTG